MAKRKLIATASFGLEAVVKREIADLGYKIIKTEDGKVTYEGNDEAIAVSNIWLRCADRVLVRMAEFEAREFEELFQQVKGIAWEELIPQDGRIIVDGSSVKSQLSSVPAVQKVAAKAVYERLCEFYALDTMPETGALYRIKVTLLKDRATVTVDTTGPGLHKRGYRVKDVKAPIKETLAAALVQLTFYKKDRLLVDLCTGSGTIPIEAALIALNIAPGLNRHFTAEEWIYIDSAVWSKARKEALSAIDNNTKLKIYAMDIDQKAIDAAKTNALEAGVSDNIVFEKRDLAGFVPEEKNGIIISNPPYGKRIGEEGELIYIYKAMKKLREKNPDWSLFVITADKRFESKMGARASRRRKIYNGRVETCYYQYPGEKPERKKAETQS